MKGTLLGIDVLLTAITYIIYAVLTVKRNYLKTKKDTLPDYPQKRKSLDHHLLITARFILFFGIILILGIFFL